MTAGCCGDVDDGGPVKRNMERRPIKMRKEYEESIETDTNSHENKAELIITGW